MALVARGVRVLRPSSSFTALLQAPRTSPVSRYNASRSLSATTISLSRKYTKAHEWIDVSADHKTGVIGISQYAANALGDVVYVELPEKGKDVQAGDSIGAVESVKSAADINAPIACTISHVNMDLEEQPGIINKLPEDDSVGGGWIAKVSINERGVKDLESLMDADEYNTFTTTEGNH